MLANQNGNGEPTGMQVAQRRRGGEAGAKCEPRAEWKRAVRGEAMHLVNKLSQAASIPFLSRALSLLLLRALSLLSS